MLVTPYIYNLFNRIGWWIESKHWIRNIELTCTRYDTVIYILTLITYTTMKRSLPIILINRRNFGTLPVLFKNTIHERFIYDICQWFRNIRCCPFQWNEVHTHNTTIALNRLRYQISFNICILTSAWNKSYEYSGPFQKKIIKFEIWNSFFCRYWQNDGWNYLRKCHK